jgi:opacity protein-like surface antigen
MKHAYAALALPVVLAVLAAAPVAGQRIDSPYRFVGTSQHAGLFAGQLSASAGRLDMGPQPGPTFGARWGIRVSGPLAVGLEVGYTPTQRTVRDTVFVAADSSFRALGDADMRLLSFMGQVRFNITGARTWHGLQPFVGLGAGAVFDRGERRAFDENLTEQSRYNFGTTFAAQVGAGVEWFATERLAARIDARNMMWKLGIPDAFLLTEHGRTLSASDWENNFILSAGLSLHF